MVRKLATGEEGSAARAIALAKATSSAWAGGMEKAARLAQCAALLDQPHRGGIGVDDPAVRRHRQHRPGVGIEQGDEPAHAHIVGRQPRPHRHHAPQVDDVAIESLDRLGIEVDLADAAMEPDHAEAAIGFHHGADAMEGVVPHRANPLIVEDAVLIIGGAHHFLGVPHAIDERALLPADTPLVVLDEFLGIIEHLRGGEIRRMGHDFGLVPRIAPVDDARPRPDRLRQNVGELGERLIVDHRLVNLFGMQPRFRHPIPPAPIMRGRRGDCHLPD